jgi:ABC-type dipeptide/oligopeptide/nickel transport system ATPase component
VRGVTIEVEPGEKVGIVGESGSGKTLTMLSVLRLLASPPLSVLSGEVLLDGEDHCCVSGVRSKRRYAPTASTWPRRRPARVTFS